MLNNNISLTSAFNTISNFNGTLDGNLFTIGGVTKPLFLELGSNALVKNLNIVSSSFSNTLTYQTVLCSAVVVIANNGTLNNVHLTANLTLATTSAAMIGGMVYLNNGTIADSSVALTANDTKTLSRIGAFAYKNTKSILNSSVLNSTIQNFAYAAGFLYINNGLVSHCVATCTLYGNSSTTRRAGFSYDNAILGASQNTFVNCTAYVTFTFPGNATTNNSFAFSARSNDTTITSCMVYVNYNNNTQAEFNTFHSSGSGNVVSADSEIIVL